MTTKPRGLYIHIPFCVKKCNYCDFCSFGEDTLSWRKEYIAALCRELKRYKDDDISLDTIFFGGGTPSLLTIDEIDIIFSKINECFLVLPGTEITLEANPKTLTEEKIDHFISKGVNRLSIGLQSIHENEQKKLGRIHNYEDFVLTYDMARRLGLKNINIDLMYGIPAQTMESFRKTLESVVELEPEHISLYGLILEEGTPFFNMKDTLVFPEEDMECDMYYAATDFLREKGYVHYEISNYSKVGFSSRHNLKYWHSEEYIGVGVSAYSYYLKHRYGNSRSIDEYLLGNFAQYNNGELIDSDAEAYEFVMLSLRLAEGFSLTEYKRKFGVDFITGREEIVNRFLKSGHLKINNDRLYLTESGLYISNHILTELL